MATEIIMPKLGMAQEEGTVLSWYRRAGELVTKGEPLVSVETDKLTVDLEAPVSGILLQIVFGPGEIVPVTTVIGMIGEPADLPLTRIVPAADKTANKPASIPAPESSALPTPVPVKVRAAPAVRQLARDQGIDLALVNATGPGGVVSREDLENYLARRSAEAAETIPMNGMRRAIAQKMQTSWSQSPHIFLTAAIDMTEIEIQRAAWNRQREARGLKLSVTAVLVYAIARLLTRHRRLNARFTGSEIVLNKQINIGIAVAMEEGLIVPVVTDSDQLSLDELAARAQRLIQRARQDQLSPTDVAGGTFTISNLGMFGIDHFTALINPPESAILAVGGIHKEMAALNGKPVFRSKMRVTLSIDHRVADGAVGAQFLADLRNILEAPDEIFA